MMAVYGHKYRIKKVPAVLKLGGTHTIQFLSERKRILDKVHGNRYMRLYMQNYVHSNLLTA